MQHQGPETLIIFLESCIYSKESLVSLFFTFGALSLLELAFDVRGIEISWINQASKYADCWPFLVSRQPVYHLGTTFINNAT